MKRITVTEAAERQKAGAVLVDVREHEEFQSVAASGAILIPLSRIQRDGLRAFEDAGVDAYREGLLLICRSGGRSAMVCESLGEHAINVDGGMLAWQMAGLPIR